MVLQLTLFLVTPKYRVIPESIASPFQSTGITMPTNQQSAEVCEPVNTQLVDSINTTRAADHTVAANDSVTPQIPKMNANFFHIRLRFLVDAQVMLPPLDGRAGSLPELVLGRSISSDLSTFRDKTRWKIWIIRSKKPKDDVCSFEKISSPPSEASTGYRKACIS